MKQCPRCHYDNEDDMDECFLCDSVLATSAPDGVAVTSGTLPCISVDVPAVGTRRSSRARVPAKRLVDELNEEETNPTSMRRKRRKVIIREEDESGDVVVEIPEEREGKYIGKPTTAIKTRINRAMTQRLYLISEEDCSSNEGRKELQRKFV